MRKCIFQIAVLTPRIHPCVVNPHTLTGVALPVSRSASPPDHSPPHLCIGCGGSSTPSRTWRSGVGVKSLSSLAGILIAALIMAYPGIAIPDSVTDTFTDETKIFSKENLVVPGGQVKLAKANGTACTSGSECSSGYCVDSVCCNTTCTGSTCQTCGTYSSGGVGTCGYVNSSAQDPDNECGTTGCLTGNCKGDSYACGYYSDNAEHNCTTACTTCNGATSGSCVNMANNTQDTQGSYLCNATCKKCSSGTCVNQAAGEDFFNHCPVGACSTPVVLNSNSGISCDQKCGQYTKNAGVCSGAGACSGTLVTACLCSGIGTMADGTDGYYVRMNGGCGFWGNGGCSTIMSVQGTSCPGQSGTALTYWTRCRCN